MMPAGEHDKLVQQMSKAFWMVAAAISALLISAGAHRLRRDNDQRAEEEASVAISAERGEALADSPEITRESKAYRDVKNARSALENGEMQLKVDQLRYDSAGPESKPQGRLRIERDATIVTNAKLAAGLINPNTPTLDPHQTQGRIEAHNRKYPGNKLLP
jgi:hypothetical protein